MSIFALLVAAVVATSYSVSGTYAKYTSTFEATDSARVAKWAFKINDTDVTNSFTFNLFDTVNEIGTTEDDTDVANGTDETIIAPGTTGSFDIKLANASEVTAKYAINYEVTKNNIPVEFSVDGGNTWTTDLANVVASDDTVLNIGADTTITVQWRWVFEVADDADTTEDEATDRDSADTGLGTAETPATITVNADITVTQVD